MVMACGHLLKGGDALLLVDIQRDFLSGGSLAVPGADRILPAANRLIEMFASCSLPIVASRDWHPRDHCSFREFGGLWPVHCVAGTNGARFPDKLALPEDVMVVSKASEVSHDSFSAFDDTGLATVLRERSIARLYVGGLATEYCVATTVTDAIEKGFQVVIVLDAIRALNCEPGDGDRALSRLESLGAQLITIEDVTTDSS